MKNKSLSILIPVLNEEDNIIPTLERILLALKSTVEDYEIIVIDDGSKDETAGIVKNFAINHPKVRILSNIENMGLGYCYSKGVNDSRKEFFVYVPGDNTWTYDSLVALFGKIQQADVITSFASNPGVRGLCRRIISRLFTISLNLLFKQHMNYYNGLTIYHLDFLRKNPVTTTGFGFQAELLLKAIYSELLIIELKLEIDERNVGSSKAVTFHNILSVAVITIRLFFQLRVLNIFWKKTNIKKSREND